MPTNTAAASKNYPFERPAIIAKGQRPKEDVATTLQAVMHNFDRNRPNSSGSYKYTMPAKTTPAQSEPTQKETSSVLEQYRTQNDKSFKEHAFTATQSSQIAKQISKKVVSKAQHGYELLKRRQTSSGTLSSA
jgi:hypothetical protein